MKGKQKPHQSINKREVDFGDSLGDLQAFTKCIVVNLYIKNFITAQIFVVVSRCHDENFEICSIFAFFVLVSSWNFVDEREIPIVAEFRIRREVYSRFRIFFIHIECAPHCSNSFNHNNSCDPNRSASEILNVKNNGARQSKCETFLVLFPCQFHHVCSHDMVSLSPHLLKLSEHSCNCGCRSERGNPSAQRADPFSYTLCAGFARRRIYGAAAQHGDGCSADYQDQSGRREIQHCSIDALPRVVARIHGIVPNCPADGSLGSLVCATGPLWPSRGHYVRRAA